MYLPEPVTTGRYRESTAWRKGDIEDWIIAGGLKQALLFGDRKRAKNINDDKETYKMSDVEQAYVDANATIEKARDAYNTVVKKFRSEISNDLKSIASSAEKTVKEYEKMRSSYVNAVNVLTSDDMEKAIINAERLATALKTIGEVKSAEVRFKLMDQD